MPYKDPADQKAWRVAHAEESKLRKAAEYRENAPALRARQKLYYQANTEAVKAYQRRHRESNPDKRRSQWLKKLYGITLEQFNLMLDQQSWKCAGCQQTLTLTRHRPDSCHVDHDHKTGRVRGLLCSRCNAGLGLLKDSVTILIRLAAYLGNP